MIYYIPPRFIDDITLLEEHEYSYFAFKNWENRIAYVRHEIIEAELDRRKIDYNNKFQIDRSEVNDFLFQMPVCSIEAIEFQIERLFGIWESNRDFDPHGNFTEQLALTNLEDIKGEMEWLFSLFKEELQL